MPQLVVAQASPVAAVASAEPPQSPAFVPVSPATAAARLPQLAGEGAEEEYINGLMVGGMIWARESRTSTWWPAVVRQPRNAVESGRRKVPCMFMGSHVEKCVARTENCFEFYAIDLGRNNALQKLGAKGAAAVEQATQTWLTQAGEDAVAEEEKQIEANKKRDEGAKQKGEQKQTAQRQKTIADRKIRVLTKLGLIALSYWHHETVSETRELSAEEKAAEEPGMSPVSFGLTAAKRPRKVATKPSAKRKPAAAKPAGGAVKKARATAIVATQAYTAAAEVIGFAQGGSTAAEVMGIAEGARVAVAEGGRVAVAEVFAEPARPQGETWIETLDPISGRPYWYSSVTNETTWIAP